MAGNAPLVGLLALQGAWDAHRKVLENLGVLTREVRTEKDLAGLDGLVLPGGESTTLTRLLMEPGTGPGTDRPWVPLPLWHRLKEFGSTHPVMGTCAGLIMMSSGCDDPRVHPLGLLPVRVDRNAWGPQTESFRGMVRTCGTMAVHTGAPEIPATFIRAPRLHPPADMTEILAILDTPGHGEPVAVRYGQALGMTFHPELSPESPAMHRYFLKLMDC